VTRNSNRKHILLALLILMFGSVAVSAQEFRATISGRVTDPSGAVIPGAKITITNTNTRVSVNSKTTGSGEYSVPFLLPGKYEVSVAAEGFSGFTRDGITVQTGDRLGIDVTLKPGSMTQEVRVTADAPLIQTETATAGQVLTAAEVENLPSNGRSPLGLAKTMYGVVPKSKNSVVQTRPFDNSASSDFSIGGGNSQSNEVLLNGVPNMQDSSRVSGYSPSMDSVEAIRVDVFEADASYGDTSGGTVNLTTKAGTNAFHGTASEFNQFSAINAPARWYIPPTTVTPATRQNQYGFTFGGPVWIPKVFNGRDKLFFFYSYERFKGTTPDAQTNTVPTEAERNGDFSALLALGNQYQLYDPSTGVVSGSGIKRSPFAGNIISPSRINAVAKAYLKYVPLPNLPGSADGEYNYFSNVPTTDDYNSHSGRLDFSFNANNKLFFETHRSEYKRTQSNIFQNIATGTRTYNVYQGGLLDYVHTFTPTMTMDSRLSLTRSYSNSTLSSQGLSSSSLGFPDYIDANSTELVMPRITFSEPSGTKSYAGLSTTPGTLSAFDTVQLFAALTKVIGHQTIKIGPDIRENKYAKLSPGSPSGSYSFNNTFVSSNNAGATNPFGGSLASFLLGIPTSGTQTIATPTTYNQWYTGAFLQDDWRVFPSLTLNLGIRVEHETPITEAHNKAVVGWDSTLENAATAPSIANYTAKPIPELPLSAFNPRGGVIYASNSRRNEYNTAPVYVSPRFGFSFAPPAFHDRTVIRGGFGIFVNPFNDYSTPQSYGYTATTALVSTTNNNLTPAASLSDPFPVDLNPIQQPTGSALGVNTNLGNGIVFRGPDLSVPYSQRWNMDIQQQLSKNLMIDIGYIGNHQVHLSYSNAVSSIPLLPFLSHSPVRDTAVTTNMTSTVANPFHNVAGVASSLSSPTKIAKAKLLQGYPEYTSVTQQLVPGASGLFHELIVRVQKRASHGLTFNFNYEYSHNLITGQLNPGGPLTYGESTSDYPQHISVAGTYVLPFGHGQTFLNHSRLADVVLGGFTANATYIYLSGTPIQWSNPPAFANGTSYDNRLKINPRSYNQVFDQNLFDRVSADQPDSYNYRTFPQYYGRGDSTTNLDMSVQKEFHFWERVRMQYRFEAYNLTNRNQFALPNMSPTSTAFGVITASQLNKPRSFQQGLRVVF